MITLTRKSLLTGIERSREFPITWEQVHQWEKGELIQNVFPDLSIEDREFILTGIVEEEWENMSKEQEELDKYVDLTLTKEVTP